MIPNLARVWAGSLTQDLLLTLVLLVCWTLSRDTFQIVVMVAVDLIMTHFCCQCSWAE